MFFFLLVQPKVCLPFLGGLLFVFFVTGKSQNLFCFFLIFNLHLKWLTCQSSLDYRTQLPLENTKHISNDSDSSEDAIHWTLNRPSLFTFLGIWGSYNNETTRDKEKVKRERESERKRASEREREGILRGRVELSIKEGKGEGERGGAEGRWKTKCRRLVANGLQLRDELFSFCPPTVCWRKCQRNP